jgi:hypothetical protein
MKRFFAVAFIIGVSCLSAIAQRTTTGTRIINQPNAPIKIISYNAVYVGSSSSYVSRGIHHSLEYENSSGRTVVAIQFGLVSFDIWNEFLDRTGGVTMETIAPGSKEKGKWVATSYADFSFHTGVAYVSKVRFDDGEIWSADLTSVVLELRKIEKDFDASRLKKKDDGEKP